MGIETGRIHTMRSFSITVEPQEVLETMPSASGQKRILQAAVKVIGEVSSIWQPKAIYKWVNIGWRQNDGDIQELRLFDSQVDDGTSLQLGFSAKFMKPAQMAMVCIYTAGRELDLAARQASQSKELLDAYLIDLVALRVLKKVENALTTIVEKEAASLYWGVSPYLSPGSVHGWDLTDQRHLCSLLPFQEIDVLMDSYGTLTPFKTVSCLFGIGPDYESTSVGATCQVCSNREKCDHRQL